VVLARLFVLFAFLALIVVVAEKMLGAAEEGNDLVGEAATALEEGDTQTFGEPGS
jgi:hypothetical protein